MPANSRSTKSSRKVSKKAAKKTGKKVAKKVAKKPANKAGKKVARKSAKKVGKRAAKTVGKKARKKVAKKVARRPQGARNKAVKVSAESRREMIAKAAYYRAEKRHFQGGDPVADWLYCEKEVDALLSKTVS